MIDAGCDLVEVGVPFSDPVIDGPTIQAAADAALRGRVPAAGPVRRWSSGAAAGGTAVVMTYWNPVLPLRRRRVRPRPRRGGRARASSRPTWSRTRPTDWLAASDDARPGPDLPGRAVLDGGADRADRAADHRFPVRDGGHGRDRRAGRRSARRCRAGGQRRERTPRCRSASGWACGPASRRPRSPAFADAVIVGSAFVSRAAEGVAAVRSLAAELAEGVRRPLVAR